MNEFFEVLSEAIYIIGGVIFIIGGMLIIGKWFMGLIDELKL